MIIDVNYARQLAQSLLDIQSIIIKPEDPFTWSSGWKSPIYCDNRLLLAHPNIRKNVKNTFISYIQKESQKVDAIAGVATAGIPHATMIADALDLPLAYVRSSAKKHGMGNKIEGELKEGQRVIVVEDLISTGGSSLEAVKAIREKGCEVDQLLGIFTYGFDMARESFNNAGVSFFTLTDYPTLLEVALENNYIKKEALETLNEWREAPENWGK